MRLFCGENEGGERKKNHQKRKGRRKKERANNAVNIIPTDLRTGWGGSVRGIVVVLIFILMWR